MLAALAGLLSFPAGASAFSDPQQFMVPGSDWFDGSAIQQPGENCSTLGEPYTEIMINGYGSYGGVAGGGPVHVNDQYYTSLLVGVPGNPCGSGNTSLATDLKLPAHTAYDSSRPIRCFGTTRFSNDFFEITNQTWNYAGQSGRYCPTGPSAGAPSGVSGAQNYGFRPLANGQFFMIFVPVKTTAELHGAGEPGETGEFNWLTVASAADANPYRSYTWANVLPSGGSSTPYVYFARNPSAEPYWDATAASGEENRAEFWANLYSAGEAGNLCFEVRRVSDNGYLGNCVDAGFNGTVPAGGELFQVFADGPDAGPNGGYVPFWYGNLFWGQQLKITWDFQYNGGSSHAYSDPQLFTLLSGPDLDGDQVADSADACPDVKGTLANGCLPNPTLKGGTTLKKGAKLKRRKLKRGLPVPLTCNLLSKATGLLTVKGKKVASGRGSCTPAGGGKLKLKLTSRAKRTLHGKHPAKLKLTFTKSGTGLSRLTLPVKIV